MLEKYIFNIRGHRVMLSTHLAELYGVEARALVQSVKRNKGRFPEDFMFQLTENEYLGLKSQFVISKGRGGIRHVPYAFTEQGISMLSSVLNSQRAIQVNITIMRTFVKIRQFLSTHKELAEKIQELEKRADRHDKEIQAIFEAIKSLIAVPEKQKRQIGFHSK